MFRYGPALFADESGFSPVATISLALGIGANPPSRVLNAVLLRMLPGAHADTCGTAASPKTSCCFRQFFPTGVRDFTYRSVRYSNHQQPSQEFSPVG